MLEAMRKGAGTWIAKIFIGLLVLSFAVWGVADIFGGYGQRSLAKVGDAEISTEEYRFSLQTELQVLGRQIGRTLTMEEARAFGLDRQVLARLVGNAALEAHASELKLGISDKAIADGIVKEPTFRDSTGAFNKQIFDQVLRSNGLSEQGYIARQRKASVRRQLTRVVSDAPAIPKALLAAVHQFQNETRVLTYFVFPADKLAPVADPSDADLKTFYDGNARSFTAPELRKLSLLSVTPTELSGSIEIGDDELKAYYEARKASYKTPEKRRVLQISFTDKESADKAHTRLTSGTDFMAIAKERKFSESDVDLGKVTKEALADPAVAEAAFKLSKDEIGAPVQGRFGAVILKVTEIEPEVVRAFQDVKGEIRETLAKERAANDILDLHDKIEDERAAGSTLAEIAKKLSLKHWEISAIDRNGNGPDGKAVAPPIPASAQVLRTAFDGEVGLENDAVETPDQGYVWVDVLAITPERLKPLAEVRAQAVAEWRTAEKRKSLAKKGQEFVDRAKTGEPLDAIAKSLGLTVAVSEPLKRTGGDQTVPRAAVTQAFALSEGGVGSAVTSDAKGRIVFKVTKIGQPAPLDAKTTKAIEDQLQSLLAEDYISQYVSGLRSDFGVTINQAALNQLTGRESAGGESSR